MKKNILKLFGGLIIGTVITFVSLYISNPVFAQTANFWTQNGVNVLSTNTSGGLATADIHVHNCYIGTGTSTPCSVGGGGFSGSLASTQIAFGSATNTISGSSNFTWDGTKQTINVPNNLTTLISGLALTNTATGTGSSTVQNSPALSLVSNIFTIGANEQQTWNLINEPTVVGPSLNFYGQRGAFGPKIKLASLLDSNGNGDFSANVLTADQSITALNGGYFQINGTVSGTVQWRANSTTATYALVWPAAQGGTSTVLTNDGTGGLSWTTPAGGIGGSITNGQVAFGSSTTNAIAGSDNMLYDSTNILLTLNHAGLATASTTAFLIQNSATSTSGAPVQVSPALEFKGHMWQSGSGGSDHTGTFRIYQIPKNGVNAGQTTPGNLQIDVSKDGGYSTNLLNLTNTGSLNVLNGITAQSQINSVNGAIVSGSQLIAASDVLSGTNGTYSGHLFLLGSTSGNLSIVAPAVVTSYSTIWPGAQGTGALTNDGAGNLSWSTTGSTVSTNATLTGDGSGGSPLGIALTHANAWTGTQDFGAGGVVSIGSFGLKLVTATSSVDFIPPASLTSYTLTLPSAVATTADQAITSSTSGTLSFTTVPIISASARQTGRTAATSLATTTVGTSDSSYWISANINITATSTSYNFSVKVAYTDETNTAQLETLSFASPFIVGGGFTGSITNLGGTGVYEGVPIHIRAKAGTTIVLSTTGTFTTITYNFEENITKIN